MFGAVATDCTAQPLGVGLSNRTPVTEQFCWNGGLTPMICRKIPLRI
jgi:hypothetical protein